MADEKQEKQVRANIDPQLDEELTRAARRLGIHKKDFVAEAIKAKLGKFDVDFECKKLRAENTTLNSENKQLKEERDAVNEKVATAEKQASELKEEADRLERENTTMKTQRDDAVRQRDHFKSKFEEAEEAVAKLESDLDAMKGRGLLERVFNV